MSIQFNDTTTGKGLVQLYELECGYNPGDISGDTTALARFAAEVNICLDNFFAVAIQATGTWQIDDSNHTRYAEITTDLVANRRDYKFTVDGQGNLIQEIYKVFAKDQGGIFRELMPVDRQAGGEPFTINDGQNLTGVPTMYDKTGNALFLDLIPSYNSAGGLKMLINREASYFTYDATTKKPGVPGLFHDYFYLKPALNYARRNTKANYNQLLAAVMALEGDEARNITGKIAAYFSNRARDEKPALSFLPENNQ